MASTATQPSSEFNVVKSPLRPVFVVGGALCAISTVIIMMQQRAFDGGVPSIRKSVAPARSEAEVRADSALVGSFAFAHFAWIELKADFGAEYQNNTPGDMSGLRHGTWSRTGARVTFRFDDGREEQFHVVSNDELIMLQHDPKKLVRSPFVRIVPPSRPR